jgi:hypothetical protein
LLLHKKASNGLDQNTIHQHITQNNPNEKAQHSHAAMLFKAQSRGCALCSLAVLDWVEVVKNPFAKGRQGSTTPLPLASEQGNQNELAKPNKAWLNNHLA